MTMHDIILVQMANFPWSFCEAAVPNSQVTPEALLCRVSVILTMVIWT